MTKPLVPLSDLLSGLGLCCILLRITWCVTVTRTWVMIGSCGWVGLDCVRSASYGVLRLRKRTN